MKIGLLVRNYSDGTQGIAFFRSVELALQVYVNEDEEWKYADTDGVTIIDVPKDFVPAGFWADDEY